MPGSATILNSTTPIFTFLLTARITRHEPVTLRKLLGVVAGHGRHLPDRRRRGARRPRPASSWAQLAIVAATICYAGAAIFGRDFKGLDPMMPAAGSMLCGAAMLLPLSLVDRPAMDAGALDRRRSWRCSACRCSRPRSPS